MTRRRIRHTENVHFFAERLKEVRRSRNMTQAELARRASVPSSYISDLEKAKTAPGIDLVDRLAKALETSVTDLLPAAAPPETLASLREQAKMLLDDLVQAADRDVLLAVKSVLSLFRELSTKRR
jgi:transcriptional regulator with XRE-family HTH domain